MEHIIALEENRRLREQNKILYDTLYHISHTSKDETKVSLQLLAANVLLDLKEKE